MPYFKVLIEGSGLALEMQGAERAVVGFFTTRVVFAVTDPAARAESLARVLHEWRAGPYGAQRGAGGLSVRVSNCAKIGFVQGLLRKPCGYSFFQARA